MILGNMVPFPKYKKKSLCDSDNYRANALSNVIDKMLDLVVLINERRVLTSSNLLFGFKNGLSTTHCTFCMNGTINYYNYKRLNVYVLFLDNATKVFDRVKYCKLFNELCKRKMSPLITILLLFMYTNQRLQVKWGNETSSQFNVLNGVKQGGVLSPILFAVYMDGLLDILAETGVGCHMGIYFIGALTFADDLNLLSLTLSGLKVLVNVCEKYAEEYNVTFNGSKSRLLLFKGMQCKV